MGSTSSRRSDSSDGARRPRVWHAPVYDTSAGREAVELAALAGLNLDEWQQNFLIASLGERDGKWAAMECGLVVPRQNGKNAVLLARELAGLFILEEADLIHSAQQADTSVEQYHKLRALIENAPALSRRVEKMPAGKGTESIILKRDRQTGRAPRLMFRSRTGSGGLGFSADFLAFDEALILPEMFHGHLMPVLSARPNVQIWYTSSAVDQQRHEHGLVLARLRERAISGEDPSLVYAEYSANVERLDLVTRDMAAEEWFAEEANPALDIRISRSYVEQERMKLDLRSFANMRGNVGDWPDTSEEAGRLIAQDNWTALADPASKIAEGHMFALDIDPGQAWATLAAAGSREDGLWHIGVVEHRPGTAWIVDKAKQWLNMVSGARLVVDPRADLGVLLTELEDAGIQPIRVNASDYKDACGEFFSATVQKRLRYPAPQPELDSAVSVARTKPLLDAWKWDRASGGCITPLVACTLALWGARTQAAPSVWNLAEIAAELEGVEVPEQPKQPQPGRRSIPLEEMPPRRGLFG